MVEPNLGSFNERQMNPAGLGDGDDAESGLGFRDRGSGYGWDHQQYRHNRQSNCLEPQNPAEQLHRFSVVFLEQYRIVV
jgi:hypothetical protein